MSDATHESTEPDLPQLEAREILEAFPSPLVVCDKQGRIIFASSGFCTLLGREPTDIQGTPFMALADPHDASAVATLLSPASGVSASRSTSSRLLRAAGASLRVRLSARPWNRADGEPFFVIAVVDGADAAGRDHSVPGESREPSESDPHIAGPNESFFEVLNAQFRTMLNQVVHGTRLLAESDVPPDLRHVASYVEDSTKTLVGLISLVVEQWMIEAGRVRPTTLDFGLRSTIEDLTKTLTEMAREAGNELDAWMDHSLPNLLRGDPGRLRRIVLGLGRFVMCRVKGQVVRWRWARVAESHRHLTIQISFEARRAPGETRPAERASAEGVREVVAQDELLEWGQGPYHARCLARFLGGDAGWQVTDERVVLWARVNLEKQEERTEGLGIHARERVLVISGAPREAETLAADLQQRGWNARGTTTRADALKILQESPERGEPYRLVLVTLVLPDGSAEELARYASSTPDAAGIQVVLLADVGWPGDAEWARKEGFSAYFVRPLSSEMLHDVLIEMVRHARAKAAHASRIFVTRHSLAEIKRRPLRILVVDDDPVTRLSLGNGLNRLGHEVRTANSGEEALETLDKDRFDLILMDIRLPGQDGDAIALLVRSRERTRNQRPAVIIGMSGQATPHDTQRCLASGMNEFLPKPIDLGTLASILDSLGPGTPLPWTAPPTRPEERNLRAPEVVREPADDASPTKLAAMPEIDEGAGRTAPASSAPQEPTEAEEWIDVQQLSRACMGVAAVGSTMLKTFAAELTGGMEELQKALAADHRDSAVTRAQGLVKLCRIIGAGPCAELFAEWIEGTANQDSATAQDRLESLEQQVRQTIAHAERLERALPEALSAAA